MNQARSFLLQLSRKLQLPGDVLAGVPKIEMTGNTMCSMEPHSGLLEYDREQISIDSPMGILVIHGTELQITAMNARRITVEGQITDLAWTADGK